MAENNKKILLVDDDEFLLDMYSLKFRESGFQIELARGGEEALKLLRGGLEPDVILLDIVMPVIDGFEFLKVIRKPGYQDVGIRISEYQKPHLPSPRFLLI